MTKSADYRGGIEQVTTLTKRQAEIVVQYDFDCISGFLRSGNKTEIRGFGSFRLRAQRMKRAQPEDRRDSCGAG